MTISTEDRFVLCLLATDPGSWGEGRVTQRTSDAIRRLRNKGLVEGLGSDPRLTSEGYRALGFDPEEARLEAFESILPVLRYSMDGVSSLNRKSFA